MAVPLLVRPIVRYRDQFAQSDERGDEAGIHRLFVSVGNRCRRPVAARLHEVSGYWHDRGGGVDGLHALIV